MIVKFVMSRSICCFFS